MAEHWIAAATAFKIVADVSALSAVPRTICRRAHDGLLPARAKLLVVGNRRTMDAPIPPGFWWAKGEAALKQNWNTGDFSTWIDQEIECRAFGVAFALSGILDMVPVERRAGITRSLSVAGRPEWIRSGEAAGLACHLPGVINGRNFVVEQARLGLLDGQAVLAERYTNRDGGTRTWAEREWPIPTDVWEQIAQSDSVRQEWDLDRLVAKVLVDGTPEWLRLSGVHILAEPLRPAASEGATPTPDPTPGPRGGGRPPAEWWDDLWCAMCRQVYEGALIPKTQAEVEKAMADWASSRGHEPAVSTIRIKARKLFAVLQS